MDATAIGISGTADVTPGQPNPTLHLKLSLDGRGLTLLPRDKGLAFNVSLGFTGSRRLPLAMGAATVRVIVRDKATGQAGTLTAPVADAH